MTGNLPTAVVLGLGQNGMATARALGRLGIPVIAIDSDLRQPGAQTRYARKIHCKEFATAGPSLLSCLTEIGRSLDQRGVIFPSGDLNLSAVSDHRELLQQWFHVALPSREIVRLCLNKKAFYRFSVEHGFCIPRTFWDVTSENISDIATQISYPCLIKPFQPNAIWRQTFDTRLFVADSASTLLALFERLYRVHQDLIIQEYVPGPDSELYWSAAYLDRNGTPLAVWTGRKLRQYPRRFGSTTLAESRWVPVVARDTTTILQTIGYRGLGFVEFKRDHRDNRFKITEVTGGRTWFPHGLVTRSGINLPYIMYRDLLGLEVEVVASYQEGLKWIHEERDLKTVFLYFMPEGELSTWSWIKSYRGKRVYAYAALDDPRPFLTAMARILSAGSRRLWRGLFVSKPERLRHIGKKPKEMEEILLAADPAVGRGLRRVDFE